LEEASLLKKKVLSLYDEVPTNWRVFLGRDLKGYFDTLVVHEKDAWLIKEERISPYKSIGVGAKLAIESEPKVRFPYSFGFRPVSDEMLAKLMRAALSNKDLRVYATELIKKEPLPLPKITTRVVLQGPLIYTGKVPIIAPEKQIKLDLKLRAELMELIKRKYPHLLTMYG